MDDEKTKLVDLIDINILQQFQDFFAEAMNMSCITVDDDGLITTPSNYSEFCKINIKNHLTEGWDCDLHNPEWGRIAFENKEPLIFQCRSGLSAFAVPIVIDNKHLASMVCGQILTKQPDEEYYRDLARKAGLDENEYIILLRKVRIVTIENLKATAKLLSLLTGAISEVVNKSVQLIDKNKAESLYKKLMEAVRSSLDIDKTLEIIAYETATIFEVERIAVVEFGDKNNLEKFNIRKEYKAQENIKSPQEIPEYREVGKFMAKKVLDSKEPFIIDAMEKADVPDFVKDFYSKINVKSVVWLPIIFNEQLWGTVTLSKTLGYKYWSENDILLLKSATSQLYMAIKHAELYEQEKLISQRETFLRKTIGIIRSTFDIEEIKKNIIAMVCEYFGADRCLFADYDREKSKFLPFKIEKLTHHKIQSLKDTDLEEDFAEFCEKLKKGKNIIIKDLEKLLLKRSLPNYKSLKLLQRSGTKSDYGLSIKYANQMMGVLVIHFIREKKVLTTEELEFLKVVRDQVGIALYQAETYLELKQAVQKEKTLRQMMLASTASFNYEDIINSIVSATGKLLSADRCFYIEYDLKNYTVFPVEAYAEYLSSKKIRSHTTRVPEKEEVVEIMKDPTGKQIVLVDDIDKIDLPEVSRKMLAEDLGVKSYAIFPVRYADIRYGSIVLHYVNNYMHLSEDQIDMAVSLTNQSAIIINQIKIYEKMQKTAEREKLLRKIIELSRSSLDLNEVRGKVTEEIGKYFKADRCYFRSYFRDTQTCSKAEAEYLASDEIKSLSDVEPDNEAFRLFVKALDERKRAFYPLIVDETFAKGTQIEKYMKEVGIQVDYAIPIVDRQNELTWLLLHYSTNDPKLDEEDNKLLETVAYQLDIAFEQIKLYNTVKQNAKREILLRNLIQTIRSSLDIDKTLETISYEIAKLFNVERVAITKSIYADGTMLYQVVQEYRARDDVKSPQLVEGFDRVVEYMSNEIMKAYEPLIVNDFETSKYPEFYNDFYKSLGVKSLISMPIMGKSRLWGGITLAKTDGYKEWKREDISFLESITDQLYVAIYQAELFYSEKHNAEREAILRTISETIRSSLDVEETKQKVVDIVGTTLKADRCFIMEYDKKQNIFKPIENEYLSSENIPAYSIVDVNTNVPNFLEVMKEGMSLIVKDKQIFIDGQLQHFDKEQQAIKDFDVNSAYGLPILYNKELLGILGIHYLTNEHEVGEDEFALVTVIVEQIAIALHQAKLYNTIMQITANQNAILNNMPFMAWLKDKESRLLAVNNSFAKAAGATVNTLLGRTDYDFFPLEFAQTYVKEDQAVIETKQTISSVDLITGPEGERWHETYKSPVLDEKNNVTGTVGLARDITEEKEAQLELLRRQNEIIKANEREMIIGHLVSRAISTFDINQIKQIVKDIGIMSKADRCYFVEADADQMRGIPIDYEGEYLASKDITSIIGYEFKAEDVETFVSLYLEKKDLIVFDYDEIRKENSPQYQGIIRYADAANLKASIGIPFFSRDKLLAVLAIEYVTQLVIPNAEELDFYRIIANQIGMVFNQIKLYQETKKTADRERVLRKIIEGIRSSLDINIVKNTIVNEVGKAFGADRCFLLTHNYENNTLNIDEFSEYKSADIERSFINYDTEASEVSWFANSFKNHNEFNFSNVEEFLVQNNLKGSLEEKFLKENNIKAHYSIPVSYSDRVFGFIVVHYVSVKKLEEADINFLRTIAAQAGIAFNQAETYKATKLKAEKESLLRQIFEDIRSSLEINKIKSNIVNGTGKALKADICFIMDYEAPEDEFVINEYAEYRSSDKEKSFVNFDTKDIKVKKFVDIFRNRQDIITGNIEQYIAENNLQGTLEEKFLRDYGIKSSYNVPIIYSDHLFGYLVIEYTNQYSDYDSENLAFIRMIANQAGIALHQADLYRQTQMQAEREAFIRKIIETVGESLDLETVLNAVCKEIFELFKPDRVAIENYPQTEDYKNWLVTAQYKSGDDILGVNDIDYPEKTKEYFGIRLLEEGRDVVADDLEKSDLPDYFIATHKKMGVKSLLAVPLKEGDKKWGILVLSQVHKYRTWTRNEIELLHTVVNQAAIAVRQAELYSRTKKQAEREKFGRNIIEILRSTIDKNTIKSLFVRYIGKFFEADRVLFSEYDYKRKIYLPVDKQSEYLSSAKEKSFVDYDWTKKEAIDYIQPLLEKREVIIPCWSEYVDKNYQSQDFIDLFESSDVQSSYSFPVLYQDKIIGFFCIEFTKKDCIKMPEDDINMVRNICLQAGIALFHAQLYVRAKESSMSKESFITNMSKEIQDALSNIIENTAKLSKAELDKETQMKYLHSLNKDSKDMIELKENIASISEIESENFTLHYEQIDAKSLIMHLFNPLKHIADEGNIAFEFELENAEINADKKRLTKAMYNILAMTISLTPEGGHITLSTELKENNFYVSIRNWGENQGFYTMNIIFETLKQLDSGFIMPQKDVRLSLSVAKKIIELHGGFIHVDSMEDSGTNVWFTIPGKL